MPVDQRVNAGKLWPLLTAIAKSKGTSTPGELGPRVGVVQRSVNTSLELIAEQCKRAGLPPLPVVVKGSQGDDDEAFQRVYEFDWSSVKNPFELFLSTK